MLKKNKDNFFSWMTFDFDISQIISVAGYFKEIEKAKSEKRISEDINCIFFTTLPESDEASFNTTNILDVDGSSSFELTKAELIGTSLASYKIFAK